MKFFSYLLAVCTRPEIKLSLVSPLRCSGTYKYFPAVSDANFCRSKHYPVTSNQISGISKSNSVASNLRSVASNLKYEASNLRYEAQKFSLEAQKFSLEVLELGFEAHKLGFYQKNAKFLTKINKS